jgi:hypothetical protein
MLQQRQIIKTLGKQIDIEDPAYTKYDAVTSYQSITWIFISVNVTIYRTIALQESYENSHYIMTTEPRRCI